jgi:endonuclease/exonuclease/phosphatase family metal-dependent hydrolase
VPGEVRVLTFNLWGRRGTWDARRSVIAGGLAELRPDLVSFQEAIVTDQYDQARDLLGSEYHVVHQQQREAGTDGVEKGQGASIASRWPFKDVREVDINVTPRTADFACTTIVAEIAVPEPVGRLLLVNHLPNWQLNFERERELQAVAAGRVIEELIDGHDIHVVVAGDFTADPDSGSVRFWTGRQSLKGTSVCYRDAWESTHPGEAGLTFTPDNPLMADRDWPFRRLDYILVRCGEHAGSALEIVDCRRAFDRPVDGVWASDHFGVLADLALPESPS